MGAAAARGGDDRPYRRGRGRAGAERRRARMQRQTDPYLRDRLHDLDDLANRLLHQLTGQSYVADRDSVPENAIIVARNMGPAALLDYDRAKLRGLILEEGGPASHVAIVARALGVATVGLGCQHHRPRRTQRRGDYRRLDRRRARAPAARRARRLCRKSAAARAPAGAVRAAARRSRRHQGRRGGRAAYERRPDHRRAIRAPRTAPGPSVSSAPNCNSCWRHASRA